MQPSEYLHSPGLELKIGIDFLGLRWGRNTTDISKDVSGDKFRLKTNCSCKQL